MSTPGLPDPYATSGNPTPHGWFLAKDKKKLGPFAENQLKQMAAEKKIDPADMLLQVGTARWQPASELSWLFAPPANEPAADPYATSDKPIQPGDVSTATFHHEAAVGTMIGPYKLLQLMGTGGMGAVWMAEQSKPVKRRVALKIIKGELGGKEVLARFEAERQALAMMDHPNIAKVLDAGTIPASPSGRGAGGEGGRPYFVMELVKGIPFTKYCDDQKLTLNERLELFIPVCNAVQHAHQKGIVHRDLKPSNVLIALYDGKPVPKVIDFGIAKATHQKLTERTLVTEQGPIGTFSYMSPEQAEPNNLDIDTRADIYSLGVMLYEVLTGSLPLRAEAIIEMVRLIREVEPTKPSTNLSLSKDLPNIAAKRKLEPTKLPGLVRGDLDWIVMKCLEKERGRRYESATQLGEELQRYLSDEPVQAGPPSASYRMKKFLRRNKGPVIAAGLVLFALVAGIVGTSVGFVAAERAASEERKAKLHALESEANEKRAAQKARGAAEREKTARYDAEKAAEKEQHATAAATDRLKQVKKANEIMQSIFRDIDPRAEENGGPLLVEQLRVRLGQAADALDETAISDMETVARLQSSLAETLLNLGERKKAIELFRKATATMEKLRGADHPETLSSICNLASAYHVDGQIVTALPLYEGVLAKRKKVLGLNDPDTWTSMHNLALALKDDGQIGKALLLLEDVVARRKARLGPDHAETLMSMNSLGVAYLSDRQHLAKGLLLLEETLEKMKLVFGRSHAKTLIAMGNVAYAYQKNGQFSKALPLHEEALERRKAKLGPEHPETLVNMNNLASAYGENGQTAKAIPLREELFAKEKTARGSEHPVTLASMHNLAVAYHRHGELNKAIPLYEAAVAKRKAALRAEHPDTLNSVKGLGSAYRDAGRFADAAPLLEYFLAKESLETNKSRTAHSMANVMDNLGYCYLRLEKFPESEFWFRKSSATFEKTIPNSWGLFDTCSMLGASLLGQKKYKEAEALLRAGYDGMKMREESLPPHAVPRLTEALERLVQLYDAIGNAAEAERYRKELAERQAAEKTPKK